MTITTLSGLKTALAAAQLCSLVKITQVGDRAGVWHSLWRTAGWPLGGAKPSNTVGVVPTSGTVGAIPFTNPTGGALSHLLELSVSGVVHGTLLLYDRLWHNAGMSGTVTTLTGIGGGAVVNRPDATAFRTELWGEVYTALGSGDSTLTVEYTDQDNNIDQQATYVKDFIPDLTTSGQMFPLKLATGDTGVRDCSAYSWFSSTGTAGEFGMVIMRRLVEVPITATGLEYLYNFARLGMPRIYDNACLALMVRLTSTVTGPIAGRAVIGAG